MARKGFGSTKPYLLPDAAVTALADTILATASQYTKCERRGVHNFFSFFLQGRIYTSGMYASGAAEDAHVFVP